MTITTPEQMREAAAAKAENCAWFSHPTDHSETVNACAKHIAAEIRAIPSAPQPATDAVGGMLDKLDANIDTMKLALETADHRIAELEAALSAAPHPVAVTVKPLVWYEPKIGVFWADTLIKMSNYRVFKIAEQWRAECGKILGHYATSELAKAACQAHHDALLRDEIIIQPSDPLSDPRVVALVESELARCMRIVSAARNGDIDSDMRTILHFMQSGDSMSYDENTHEYVHDDKAKDRAALRAIGGEA